MNQLLNIGKTGLLAQSQAINTTAHNIANANTEGFSRQRVNFSPLAFTRNGQSIGNGVSVEEIQRLRNNLIDEQLQQKQSELGDLEERSKILNQLQSILSTGGDGDLDKLMSRFFDSFTQLASQPENAAFRDEVIFSADNLTKKFNSLNTDLLQAQDGLVSGTREQLVQINGILKDLAQLNTNFARNAASRASDNNSLDLQTQKLNELSQLVDFSLTRDQLGAVELRIGGVLMVQGDRSFSLSAEIDPGNSTFRLRTSNGVQLDNVGGVFGAQVDAFTESIPNLIADLDNLTQTLVERVNQLHRDGYGLTNTTGLAFFNPDNLRAGTISLNQVVVDDPRLIATANQPNSPGNNIAAVAIAGVAEEVLVGNRTLLNFALSIPADVGTQLNSVNAAIQTVSSTQQLLFNQQESVSGVNIDEELANLIKFQNAYQANARVIATADELFDSLLAIV